MSQSHKVAFNNRRHYSEKIVNDNSTTITEKNTLPSTDANNDHEAIQDATASAKRLVGFQLFSRITSLFLNTILIRCSSPMVLGVASVKLELFLTTVLYLAREGLRMSLLRYTPPTSTSTSNHSSIKEEHEIWLRRLINMAWLVLPCALLPWAGVSIAYALTVPPEIGNNNLKSWYWIAITGYTMAAIIELSGEPLRMILSHKKMQSKRVRLEAIALSIKSFLVIVLFWIGSRRGEASSLLKVALGAFSLAQVVYSLLLVTGYYYLVKMALPNFNLWKYLPIPFIDVDETIVQHAFDMTKHLLLRYLLAQGDMWIISLAAPLSDQGVYVLVTNYGSLLARIVFQPTEESGLSFFSQKPPALSLQYLNLVLRWYILLGLGLSSFGVALVRPTVGTILGQDWLTSSAPIALQIYCLLLPIMAISGILEAFIHGTIKKDWIYRQRVASIVTTIIYVTIAIITTNQWGPTGLIGAGIINFALRAVFGMYYNYQFTKNQKINWGLSQVMPHRVTIMTFVLLGALFTVWRWIKVETGALFTYYSLLVIFTLPVAILVLYWFEYEIVMMILGKCQSIQKAKMKNN